jgi:hypothetical protein
VATEQRKQRRLLSISLWYICPHQSVLLPLNTLLLVGVGVRETSDLTTVAAEEAVKLRADLVATAGSDSVALLAASLSNIVSRLFHGGGRALGESALGTVNVAYLEKVGALLGVTCK